MVPLVLGSGTLVMRELLVSLVVVRDELLDFELVVAVLPVALLLLAMVTRAPLVVPAGLVSASLVMLEFPFLAEGRAGYAARRRARVGRATAVLAGADRGDASLAGECARTGFRDARHA